MKEQNLIMLKKTLLDGNKKQFKANLHCHSNLSDGALTPEELKRVYKEHGYDVLAITDHCRPCDHSDLTDEDFLMLTGYEAYIRPSKSCTYDVWSPEVHLNLFAKEPHNLKYVCYNSNSCKYFPKERHSELEKVGSEKQREYTTEYVNEFIRTAVENGYLVAYNHPFWSMESEERILSYKGYFSLEIFNTGSYKLNGIENAEQLYDKMLRLGYSVGCHGGDDNHNKKPFGDPDCDSFDGHTMILADRLEYSEIAAALEAKECYASRGPRINEISIHTDDDGDYVHVECSPAKAVYLFVGAKNVKSKKASDGLLTSVDIPLDPAARYVRISVWDEGGKSATSRGFLRDEWA